MAGIYRHITTTTEQGVLVIVLDLGEVKDYIVAEELKIEMVHAVQRSRTDKFVLDLHNTEFITSLACVAFIGLKHVVREIGGRLVLCEMSEFIRKIFNAKRLLTPSQRSGNVAFEEAGTLADAIRRMNSPAVQGLPIETDSPAAQDLSSEPIPHPKQDSPVE